MISATVTSDWMRLSRNWKKTALRSYWCMSLILLMRARRQENLTCRSRGTRMAGKSSFLFWDLPFCRLRDENIPVDSIKLELCCNTQTAAWAQILYQFGSIAHPK